MPFPIENAWRICIILALLLWGSAFVLWAHGEIDEQVLFYYDPLRAGQAPAILLSQALSTYGIALIALLYGLHLWLGTTFEHVKVPVAIYVLILCSLGLSGIAGDVLKVVFSRPRPDVSYAGQIMMVDHWHTPAFPSGHATKSMALALPFLCYGPIRKWIHHAIRLATTLLALGVCGSRVILAAHYTSDVLAGIGMAFLGLPLAILVTNTILKRYAQENDHRLRSICGGLLAIVAVIAALTG